VFLNPQQLKEERRAGELLAAGEKWRNERDRKGDKRERERERERESGREQAGCGIREEEEVVGAPAGWR